MNCCSLSDCNQLTEQLNFNVRETEDGVTVEVTPKDPKKVGALKKLADGMKSFCNC